MSYNHWKGQTRYRKHGKILEPLTDEEFSEGMQNGYFVSPKHRGFVVLLYYSAVRKHEVLRATKEQFKLARSQIIFGVGKRLKHGIETPPLNIPLKAPFAKEIWDAVETTKPNKRVFPYSDKTGYNIVSRVFKYPHFFRLSRITNFFDEGWSIVQVRSWTGLSLKALNYYVGLVDVKRMGESLAKKKGVKNR